MSRRPPKRHGEPRHFRKSARDQRRHRVGAESQSRAHSRRDGDHVFYRAGNLGADHIVVGVEPESRSGEFLLDFRGQRRVRRCENNHRGVALGDFDRKTRSGENGDARGIVQFSARLQEDFGTDSANDFADARVGGGLESLGRADEYRMRLKVRPHGAIHLARMGRRHHTQHDVRPGEGLFQRAGDFNFRGQFETGQIDFVDALRAQQFHDVGAVRP